jgi:hypothetical protein
MRTFNSIIGSAFCNLACVRELPDQINNDFSDPPSLFKERDFDCSENKILFPQGQQQVTVGGVPAFVGERIWIIKSAENNAFINKTFKNKKGKHNKNRFKAPKVIKSKGKLPL